MKLISSFSSKAILLRKVEYGESDSIITFFTEESGKVVAFARSAKKSKKRFGTTLDLLAFVNAQFSGQKATSSFYSLNSTTIVKAFENIRKNLDSIAMASYVLELFCEMTAEGVKNRNLFYFLHTYLSNLDNNEVKRSHLPLYALKFLRLIGLGPNFSECMACKNHPDNRRWFFSADRGGIICPNCLSQRRPSDTILRLETLNILKREREMGENLLKRISLSRGSARELSLIVDRFIQYHLGKRLNSYRFMEEIGEEAGQRV